MSYPLEVNNESGTERKETKNKPENAEESIALRTRSKNKTKKPPFAGVGLL
uniref:PEST proteolytic signal-containing nuclear protein n=1 Tax=Loa loa TaxID=7209 RepID=A0A1I7V9M0_LOALO